MPLLRPCSDFHASAGKDSVIAARGKVQEAEVL